MQKYSGVGLFSSIIKCGECGSWYGVKDWHSNDKYRKVFTSAIISIPMVASAKRYTLNRTS
ncbi:MAG: zinc ribbon domain-containing protein [Coprococcus sp.]